MVFESQNYNRSLNKPNFSFDICFKKVMIDRKIEQKQPFSPSS